MRNKLFFTAIISILVVLFLVASVSSLEDNTPPQITITSPEDDSIITDYLISETIVPPSVFWKVETYEDKLELGESISEVVNSIGSNELTFFADNIWSVDGIDYEYSQSLSFDSGDLQNELVNFTGKGGQASLYFYIKEGQQIGRYNVNFETPVLSKIDADRLIDLQGTTLTLFGKEYSVFRADRTSQNGMKIILRDYSSNYINELVLEDQDITDDISTDYEDDKAGALLEGVNHLFTLNGKEYLVQLVFVDDNHAKFIINGEPTPLMDEGNSLTISEGVTLILDKVIYQDFAGGVHQAKFSIKAINSSKLNVNDQTVEGAYVKIKGTIDGEMASLSSIEVDMIAQDDYYVAPGETLLEQPELENKNLLFAQNFDIKFDGLEPSINRNVPTHDISFDDPRVRLYEISIKSKAGEGEYWLTFTNNEDRKITVPIAYANSNSVSLGSTINKLNLENSNIAKGEYFITNTGLDENSVTNLVQYKQSDGSVKADGSSESNPKIFFTILATGETVQRLVSFDSNGVATATLKFSGITYTITSVGDTSKDNYNISITGGAETSTGNPYGFENYLIARGGAKITLAEKVTDSNAKSLNVDINLIDSNNVGDSITVSPEEPYLISSVDIVAVDNKVDLTDYTGINLTSPENDPNNAYGYSVNGAFVTLNSPTESTSDTLDIDWPKRQRLPVVYITDTPITYYAYYIDLQAETDEDAECSYDLGAGYNEMDDTGGKNHYQALTDLKYNNTYNVSVQCVDESENTNTETIHFHFGEVADEPTEEPPQNQPSNTGGSSFSSSKKKDNSKDEDMNFVEETVTNNAPEIKKISEPIKLLAESPAEAPSNPSSSNKLTAALIGVAENGGLLYAAGLVLVIFSLLGIKIYLKYNN